MNNNKWYKYILNEGNFNDYQNSINIIKKWLSRQTVSKDDLLNAARNIISDDNARYWRYAGQNGSPNNLMSTAQDSIWQMALGIAGKNASAESTLPITTKAQVAIRDKFKINIPFLDPSSQPGLHPYWRKSNNLFIGALLQKASDIFLSPENVFMMLLVWLTGGLAGAAQLGRVAELSSKLNKILELKSTVPGAKAAAEELETAARTFLKNLVSTAEQRGAGGTWNKVLNFVWEKAGEKSVDKAAEVTSEVIQNPSEAIAFLGNIVKKYEKLIPQLQTSVVAAGKNIAS